MNSNLNKHEEKEKKPITVSWQDGDTTHVQTTVIHKRVPSAGVIVITAINTLKVPNGPNEFHRVFFSILMNSRF